MTPPKLIPFKEVNFLTKLLLEAYFGQYQKKINPFDVSVKFIPARTDTRIGFEAETRIMNDHLKIRIYAQSFVTVPDIKPFRLEDIQGNQSGADFKVFVSISDLPIGDFPVLSKTLNPFYDNAAGPNAIELEDGSGFLQTETGEFLTLEVEP